MLHLWVGDLLGQLLDGNIHVDRPQRDRIIARHEARLLLGDDPAALDCQDVGAMNEDCQVLWRWLHHQECVDAAVSTA